MFGDCQVMCSNVLGGGGNLNMVCPSSSENLFSSSPLTNPNFNSISTHHLSSYPPTIIPKEEVTRGVESGSGSEQVELEGGVSGTEQDPFDIGQQHQANPNNKKKRYHRHTTRQIQEMESLFKECPHPDDKQRMRLSQELGLKPRQVKFWFQNRRTQMKAQQDRSDNVILRAENDNLRNENYRLQAALRNIVCPNCGGPSILGEISFDEQHLRHENSRLKDELERVCCLTSHYTGRPSQAIGHPPPLLHPSLELDMNIYSRQFQDPMSESRSDMILPMPLMHPEDSQLFSASQGSDLLLSDEEQSLALQLAASSVDELVKMCNVGEPLWIRCGENEGGKEVLSIEEHAKMFPWPIILKSEMSGEDLRTEATRGSAVVIMNSVALVDAFMDADKWIELFPSIVSRARTIQAITTSRRDSAASSSLHLMYAEFQVLSPLVPTRETYFLRYCQQSVEDGAWVIVDFPFDSFRDNVQPSFPKYRRHPSGCIIQDRANGYSVVTWLEHAEVEEKPVYPIFDHLVSSGMAFGANRWLAVLQRQCERLASLMATNVSDLGVIPSLDARKNLMRLSQRMTRTFCVDISSCNNQSWTALSDSADDTVRITTREVTEPGKPYGVILTAVSTTWMPYPHYQVFDFLRDERRRSQLDVLSNGNSLHEVSHIANGSHPGNCISLLRINVASNSSQNVELVLQESCTDDSAGGSLVVFATMDVHAVQLAMSCEDPSSIPLLPLGFVIVPSSHPPNQESSHSSPVHEAPRDAATATAGCLLTVGLQALASDIPTAKLNLSAVTAINNHLRNAVHQIRAALSGRADSESCPEPPEQ